ncbi:MAG: hypothetical protein K0R17_1245 [Rariglobus sp.]|jgi:hypothetical protein|nr:hypothetical protein [Rariglobus sp.]
MKLAFVISGILCILIWPIFLLGAVMLMDTEHLPGRIEVLRWIVFYSAVLVPPVWIISLTVAVREFGRMRRSRWIRTCIIAPYAAAATHFSAIAVLFAF